MLPYLTLFSAHETYKNIWREMEGQIDLMVNMT